jgi:hypothetical protein
LDDTKEVISAAGRHIKDILQDDSYRLRTRPLDIEGYCTAPELSASTKLLLTVLTWCSPLAMALERGEQAKAEIIRTYSATQISHQPVHTAAL